MRERKPGGVAYPDYGVPTGYVPRVDLLEPLPKRNNLGDPVAQAVDDYLLMERKARAWDALLRVTTDPVLLATMNAMVPSGQ